MKGVVDRIALFFKVGWQWLTAEPGYRGALLCGLSAIGAIMAIGFSGSKGVFSPRARISAMSDQSGAISAKKSPLKNGVGDGDAVDDSRNRKEGPSPSAIASDKSFLVADTEKKNAAIRDKDKVKKTAKKSAKKTRQRVSSDRDRKLNPSRETKRASEKVTRVIGDFF
jgi:hypothetical protein